MPLYNRMNARVLALNEDQSHSYWYQNGDFNHVGLIKITTVEFSPLSVNHGNKI